MPSRFQLHSICLLHQLGATTHRFRAKEPVYGSK